MFDSWYTDHFCKIVKYRSKFKFHHTLDLVFPTNINSTRKRRGMGWTGHLAGTIVCDVLEELNGRHYWNTALCDESLCTWQYNFSFRKKEAVS
jgi:hypothetical protein